jgi:hypothetical protein
MITLFSAGTFKIGKPLATRPEGSAEDLECVFHETSAGLSDSYLRVMEEKGSLESLVIKDDRG